MRMRARAAAVTAAVLLAAATTTFLATETMTFLTTAATTGTAPAEGAAAPPPMPAFVGKSLVQVFSTLDARTTLDVQDIGRGHRTVLWPFNWKVCAQTPPAGAALAEHTRVRVDVVKKAERCPER
ncbi:hypothetical protein ACIBCO_15340 [Streptomyces violascens]|uniref:hypothetical protein n=1 Tax=Streptomyces violascens TaxID=67381 RepID=UPI00379D7627